MQAIQFMEVKTAALSLPKDGKGAVTSPYASDVVSTAATTFTTTSVTSATWTAAPNTASAGDYVSTSDGCWGILVAGSNATKAVVDRWRSPKGNANQKGGGSTVLPAEGSVARVWQGKCIAVGARRNIISRITFSKLTAADTVAITDGHGTAIYTHTVPATPIENWLEFTDGGDGGFMVEGPFGIKISATTTQCLAHFRST